jgi:O-antigen ligase
VIAAGYFALLALFGGGLVGPTPAYGLLTFATIIVALTLTWQTGLADLNHLSPLAKYGLIGVALIPLLQIIPLPPAVWQALPGQALREQVLSLAGLDGTWQPLSLEPLSTALTAILAIGFVTLVLLMLRLNDAEFRRLLITAQGIVVVGILIGLSQVVTEGQFPNLQGVRTGGVLLGFYANKNHMAIILAITIPLFSLIVSPALFGAQRSLPARIVYIGFVLICIIATNSRAGLLLGLVATGVALSDVARRIPWRVRIAAAVAILILVWIVTSTSAFEVVSRRFADVDGDLRWRFLSWTWPLAKQYGLLGSGAGSFQSLFMTTEHLEWVKPTIVNHTHNEYLELLIEFGIPGLLVLALLVASLIQPFRRWWSLSSRNPRHAEMLFGFTTILLFALHSAIDYPLRRPAAWAFFALALVAVLRSQVGKTETSPTG